MSEYATAYDAVVAIGEDRWATQLGYPTPDPDAEWYVIVRDDEGFEHPAEDTFPIPASFMQYAAKLGWVELRIEEDLVDSMGEKFVASLPEHHYRIALMSDAFCNMLQRSERRTRSR